MGYFEFVYIWLMAKNLQVRLLPSERRISTWFMKYTKEKDPDDQCQQLKGKNIFY